MIYSFQKGLHALHYKHTNGTGFVSLSGNEGEDVVLKSVIAWLEHNVGERVAGFHSVLMKLRLISISEKAREEILKKAVLEEQKGILVM